MRQVRFLKKLYVTLSLGILLLSPQTAYAQEAVPVSGHVQEQSSCLFLLAALSLVILSETAVILFMMWKKRREIRKRAMIDTHYGIGNKRYYLHCLDTLIPLPLRSLYYVVCIGCDTSEPEKCCAKTVCEQLFNDAAEFIGRVCKEDDSLSYVGRGMFALICRCDSSEALKQRIDTHIQQLNTYLEEADEDYAMPFRAGICALAEYSDCSGEELLYNARQAMEYAHKHEEHSAFATEPMIEESRQRDRLRRHMAEAIERGEFEPYFQFIVDRSGKIVGAEALSRWQSAEDGTLLPEKYIDMMIRNEAIITHDLYMFRRICEQLQAWKRMGKSELFLSSNFTRRSISDPLFFDQIRQIAEEYDFPHENAIIEITEDSMSKNRDIEQQTMEAISAMGLRIALDDIGSGYSSLLDLCTFPLNIVKIDRKLLLGTEGRAESKFLSGLVHLLHGMGLSVVCEGVETRAQVDIALAVECDYIQGYFFSRALPKSEAEAYLCD